MPDTSVLTAALRPGHMEHACCRRLLDRIQAGHDEGFVSLHSVAEVYAKLTTIPLPKVLPAAVAAKSLEDQILRYCVPVPLNPAEYRSLIADLAARNIVGGTVYDGLILAAAAKAKVDRVFTLNVKHFRRIWTGAPGVLAEP